MRRLLSLTLLAAVTSFAHAQTQALPQPIPVQLVDSDGKGKTIGHITLSSSPYGVLLTPALEGLPPGLHGFHLHEKPSCDVAEKDGKKGAALAAGGHFDPAKTGQHEGPYGQGHLGDLPPLYVDDKGQATQPVLAPRLKLGDFPGHALMIHAGGDNHADHPQPLGGGGARIACGVVPL